MKIRATLLTLVTGAVISISGLVAAHAAHSTTPGDAATISPASSSTVTPDGNDPWPGP
jgi:hypothetical protein